MVNLPAKSAGSCQLLLWSQSILLGQLLARLSAPRVRIISIIQAYIRSRKPAADFPLPDTVLFGHIGAICGLLLRLNIV